MTIQSSKPTAPTLLIEVQREKITHKRIKSYSEKKHVRIGLDNGLKRSAVTNAKLGLVDSMENFLIL